MKSLDLGIVGNCSISALIDRHGRINWCCLPRLDGDPVFCTLLNGDDEPDKGFYDIELIDFAHAEQSYRRNSAVLTTQLFDRHGGGLEIIDFAPRFKHFGRIFRPMMLVRCLRPLAGSPQIRIRLRPTFRHGQEVPQRTRGSNHIRYIMDSLTLRLTTDCPVSYAMDEVPFILDREINLFLGPDESLTQALAETSREFLEQTDEYWREWCRYLSLPFEWQEAVIRAAITLKLCSYEESGAIVAAMTTSIPEAPNSQRNWDYRFCWLRDSFFVVNALNALGVTKTMESYLGYLRNIVASAPEGYLQPVYGITLEHRLDESEVPSLAGYRGMGPVRVGNDAYRQVQNDGYGSVVLASTQAFYDHRLSRMGDRDLFAWLERLGEQAVKRWNQPDSGIWEYRSRATVHTYSSVMCWAACDRLAKIARRVGMLHRIDYWQDNATRIKKEILKRGWNAQTKSFVSAFDGGDVDASLLLLPALGFIAADDPRYRTTVEHIERVLRRDGHLLRYVAADDFGSPETAFNVCTFWFIDALASIGRQDEARSIFETMLECRNHLGLLSEDLAADSRTLWGNFPQTYSMVGLIHSARKLSKPWEDAI